MVIFINANQIVWAGLQELVDLDLHGATYSYMPMGDDNYSGIHDSYFRAILRLCSAYYLNLERW